MTDAPSLNSPDGSSTGQASAAAPTARWRQAGQNLLVRLIAELAYEELLVPLADQTDAVDEGEIHLRPGPIGRGRLNAYRVVTADARYRFQARRGTFGSWWIEPASLRRASSPVGGTPGLEHTGPADDPVLFLRDAQHLLGWPDPVLADVIRDLLATQAADARILAGALPAAELADLVFVDLEGRQSGHPCLVANKGRIGFASAAGRYCPESNVPFRLVWVAAHPLLATWSDLARQAEAGETGQAGLLAEELDEPVRLRFTEVLNRTLADVSPDESRYPYERQTREEVTTPGRAIAQGHIWLPVHPWQWENVIIPLFAAELATGLLVHLGEAPDRYVPLQAVRTLANVDRPERRNVKLALMIRNTLVWRGMSAADAVAGPAVSRWLLALREADPFLRVTTGVQPLPEVAGAAVCHPAYDAIPDAPYRLHELLGVLWRDPVGRYLTHGEQARSLAALLLTGSDGRSLLAELVARSGREPRAWLRSLFAALLPPLLHYLYRYGIAFTPHGENVLCVFDADQVPRRIAIKDFGADIELVDGDFPERGPLPAQVDTHCRRWPGRELAHSVLSAVFAGHFRYFSVLAADDLHVPEEDFWQLVRAAIDEYHARFPELRARFREIDLLAPRFDRVCLNREQFAGAGFHDRAARDGGFDLMRGTVANPVASVSACPAPPAPTSRMGRTEDA
ncbi:Siderophore synthetase component [Frankia sp. AiPs1]|uniref:IucA/IucC family protein n=1 Tax=Frankia sp. AiPa1 TaxID=573492 RepID=UPI00202AD833|nr:IucA/IucC family protein [Frankia sp. AiPa1]MCL9758904.1 IucA/IucC family protein [Frankia sp. AiPa1]